MLEDYLTPNPMNIPLLKRVKAAILKHPKQFEMADWFGSVLYFGHDRSGYLKHHKAGGCGTAACIAGWTCHVALENKKLVETDAAIGFEAARKATELLELSRNQAACLFYHSAWPRRFAEQHEDAKTLSDRARAAARRIDHFIKTKGKE